LKELHSFNRKFVPHGPKFAGTGKAWFITMNALSKNAKFLLLMLGLLITGVIVVIFFWQKEHGANQNPEMAENAGSGTVPSPASAQTPEPAPAPEPEPTPPPRYYIALGDSVPAGYGVTPDWSYPVLLFQRLKEDEIANEYENLSVTGFTAGMLLAQLENQSAEALEIFRAAQVISLNVGGNHILQPLIGYLPDFQEITDMIAAIGSIAADAMLVAAEVEDLNTELTNIQNSFSFSDLLRVGEFLQSATSIFSDSVEMFGRMNELSENNPLAVLSGPLPPELEAELQQGVDDFAAELLTVLSWLEANAPDAVVVINTLYNPIPEEMLGLRLALSGQAETYTQAVNEIIFAYQDRYGYVIADVYRVFAGQAELGVYMNYHLDLAKMNLNFDIIHPNHEGHRVIAELNYEALGF
jgi:lysophospholipase L1-like esterase